MPEIITSRQNTQVKKLDMLLRQKKARKEHGLFVLEGARLCLDACNGGVEIDELYLAKQAQERYPEIETLIARAGRAILLSDELSSRIGDTKETQGVFALCKTPEHPMPRITEDGFYILLHDIRDPGNLGSILRTAASLGVSAAVLSNCAELYSPKTLRSSMGGVWRFPIAVRDDMAAVIEDFSAAGVSVIAAALREDAVSLTALSPKSGIAVLLGNEGGGLPDELIAAADKIVGIPMREGCESLGVAAAAAILIWEMIKT